MTKHFKANRKNGMGKKGSIYRTQTINKSYIYNNKGEKIGVENLNVNYDANQKRVKTIIHRFDK